MFQPLGLACFGQARCRRAQVCAAAGALAGQIHADFTFGAAHNAHQFFFRFLGVAPNAPAHRLTTGRAICDPTSGMRLFNRAMVEEFAQNLNYGPEPDTISYLIKNGAVVREVQVTMGEREAGQSYLTFWRSIEYMVKMSISILLIQWFRKRDTETPYPERSL